MLGGTIVVTSELGAGSTFSLRLPAGAPARASAAPAASKPRTPVRGPALVVSDDPCVVEGLFALLTGAGIPVLPAADVTELLRLSSHLRPLLIILDDGLGEAELLAALSALHEDPERAEIPRFVVGELPLDVLVNGTVPLSRPLRGASVLAVLARHFGRPRSLGTLVLVLGDAERAGVRSRARGARARVRGSAAEGAAMTVVRGDRVGEDVVDDELAAGLLRDHLRALGAQAVDAEVVVAVVEVRAVVALDAGGLADEQLEPALGRGFGGSGSGDSVWMRSHSAGAYSPSTSPPPGRRPRRQIGA